MCFNELISFNNVFNNIKSDGGVEFSVKFSDLKNIHTRTLHTSKYYQYILSVLTLLLIVVFVLLNNSYVHIHPRRQMVGVT